MGPWRPSELILKGELTMSKGKSTQRKPTSDGAENVGEFRFLGKWDGKLHFLDLSDVPQLDLSDIPELDLTGIPTVDDILKESPCQKQGKGV